MGLKRLNHGKGDSDKQFKLKFPHKPLYFFPPFLPTSLYLHKKEFYANFTPTK